VDGSGLSFGWSWLPKLEFRWSQFDLESFQLYHRVKLCLPYWGRRVCSLEGQRGLQANGCSCPEGVPCRVVNNYSQL
jgi:hypothetical protein